VLLRITK